MAEACNLAASRGGGNRRGTRPRVEIEEMGRDNAGERREKEKEREREWHLGSGVKFIGTR